MTSESHTHYHNTGSGSQYVNSSSGNQVNVNGSNNPTFHWGAQSISGSQYINIINQVFHNEHSVDIEELEKQLEQSAAESSGLAAVLESHITGINQNSEQHVALPSPSLVFNPTTNAIVSRFVQELNQLESHLVSLRFHIQEIRQEGATSNAGWQCALTGLSAALSSCRNEIAHRTKEISISTDIVNQLSRLTNLRELLRSLRYKVDLAIVIVAFCTSPITTDMPIKALLVMLDELKNVLEQTGSDHVAFDPERAANNDHQNTSATVHQQLRQMIDDDQRTIRAATLELESIVNTINTDLSFHSTAEAQPLSEGGCEDMRPTSTSMQTESTTIGNAQKTCVVLTLDSGYIKCVSQLMVLKKIIELVKTHIKQQSAGPSSDPDIKDVFDLVVGTGYGGSYLGPVDQTQVDCDTMLGAAIPRRQR